MLSFFKGKPATESTFKKRVEQFWAWYTQVAPRFYKTIEAGNCPALAEEVSTKVGELFPGFAWVFGPGEAGNGHSFTLSGEGNPHRQLLAVYWLAQAPKIDGWTFYAARQPGPIEGHSIQLGGHRFAPVEFWLTPTVDTDQQKVHIAVWHPLFDTIGERDRYTILFLFLDEVLGEYGTQQWIGTISFDSQRLTDSIPLAELGDFVTRVQAQQAWKKLPPGESMTLYEFQEPHGRFLRGDIMTGTTRQLQLIQEYVRAQGALPDPLKGTGADYVFVAFDARILPAGNQAHARGQIEDALDKALQAAAAGRALGGAWGKDNAYIDLLLFDESAGLQIIQHTSHAGGVPRGSSINYFAKEKRGHRIVL